MSRILVAYASSHGQTRKVAETIAAELRRYGHTVELAPAHADAPPAAQGYDAVVLGSRVQFGSHARSIIHYVTTHRTELNRIPSYFFSVSMSTVSADALDPEGLVTRLLETTHWQPCEAIAIAGGLPYRQYGFLLRMIMKLRSRRSGHTTDTSRDHEYTDWAQVRRFAAGIVVDLMSPSAHATSRARQDVKA